MLILETQRRDNQDLPVYLGVIQPPIHCTGDFENLVKSPHISWPLSHEVSFSFSFL